MNMALDSHDVVGKYDAFAHVLSINDNETLNNINKIDMLKNYIPWVPINVPVYLYNSITIGFQILQRTVLITI